MLGDPIRKVMRKQKLLAGSPATLVSEAAQRMRARNVGAILVLEGDRLVGICTERDIVFRVVAAGLAPDATPIGDVMTSDPITIDADKPFGAALAVMHREGFRHLPVVSDGKAIGVVSARSALDPELEEFASETQRRKHFDSLR